MFTETNKITSFSNPIGLFAFVVVCVACFPRTALSYDEDEFWNMSILVGTHIPRITGLRNGMLQAPMIGEGVLSPENTEEGDDVNVPFHFRSPLSGKFNAAKSGIRFQWNNDSPVSMTFGFSTWEATAYGNTRVDFPIQGALENALYEREISLSYTEYHLGAIAELYKRDNNRIYGIFALNEIFDLDYREDLTFSFHEGTDEAFQRILVLEAQTASVFSSTFGIGSEWSYNKVVSFSAELSYLLGVKSARLKGTKLSHNVLMRDQINLNNLKYPFGSTPEGNLTYLPKDATEAQLESGSDAYRKLDLSFSGWQFMLSMNIFY